MAQGTQYLAFDLGAESGRAVLGTLSDGRLSMEEVHRFPNVPVAIAGHGHWDILRLFNEITEGMRKCAASGARNLAGMGVDTWGVDFGLLDSSGELILTPYQYRDKRTEGMYEEVFKRVPRDEVFEKTGIQFMQFNTLYQLASMALAKSPVFEFADRFLMIPDLLHYFLCGSKVGEFSNATTTQCYNPRLGEAGGWDTDMLQRLGIPTRFMPEVVKPGTVLGKLLPQLAEETGLAVAPVIAPPTHDTGSAVAAVPAQGENWAYLSSGTWSLMGIEVHEPVIDERTLALNFTNEGGVEGTFRLLKNISGLWLVQQCRRSWRKAGNELDYGRITELAGQARPFASIIDTADERFLNPPDMPTAIADFCSEYGQAVPTTPGEFARCALESLALAYREVKEKLELLNGAPINVLHIVGGGTQNRLLNQLTADACGIPVVTGPVEATGAGNILVQAMATGELSSLAEVREVVRNSFELETYEPKKTTSWEEAYARYNKLLEKSRAE